MSICIDVYDVSASICAYHRLNCALDLHLRCRIVRFVFIKFDEGKTRETRIFWVCQIELHWTSPKLKFPTKICNYLQLRNCNGLVAIGWKNFSTSQLLQKSCFFVLLQPPLFAIFSSGDPTPSHVHVRRQGPLLIFTLQRWLKILKVYKFVTKNVLRHLFDTFVSCAYAIFADFCFSRLQPCVFSGHQTFCMLHFACRFCQNRFVRNLFRPNPAGRKSPFLLSG